MQDVGTRIPVDAATIRQFYDSFLNSQTKKLNENEQETRDKDQKSEYETPEK